MSTTHVSIKEGFLIGVFSSKGNNDNYLFFSSSLKRLVWLIVDRMTGTREVVELDELVGIQPSRDKEELASMFLCCYFHELLEANLKTLKKYNVTILDRIISLEELPKIAHNKL